jgi:hypothetical protein
MRVGAAGLEPLERVATAPALIERFARARRALRRERGPHPYRLRAAPAAAEHALCAARLAMWRADLPPGTRNNVAIRLASAYRLAGYTADETLELLREWNARQTQPLPARELDGVAHSAFVRPYAYNYGCHDEVIRGFCPYAGRVDECADYRTHHRARNGAVSTPKDTLALLIRRPCKTLKTRAFRVGTGIAPHMCSMTAELYGATSQK